MEIQGDLNELFLSVVSEDAAMLPHWEVDAINNKKSEAVQSDTQEKDPNNNTFYKCDLCDNGEKKRYSLERQKMQIHSTGSKKCYQCDVCGKSHSEKFRSAHHIEVEHSDKRWICDSCGKSYKSKEALNAHSKVRHTNTARYKCTKCPKTFLDREIYYGHLSKNDGTKHYICNL